VAARAGPVALPAAGQVPEQVRAPQPDLWVSIVTTPHKPPQIGPAGREQLGSGTVTAPEAGVPEPDEQRPERLGRPGTGAGDSDELLDGILELQVSPLRGRSRSHRFRDGRLRGRLHGRRHGERELGQK